MEKAKEPGEGEVVRIEGPKVAAVPGRRWADSEEGEGEMAKRIFSTGLRGMEASTRGSVMVTVDPAATR